MSDEKNSIDHQADNLNITKENERKTEETNEPVKENEMLEKENVEDNNEKTDYAEKIIDNSRNEIIENQGKKKINKGPIILISSFIGIALLIIVIISLIIVNNPKAKVAKALTATVKELDSNETFLQKASGENDLYILYKEAGGTEEELQMNILESDMKELKALEKSGLEIKTSVDNKNKMALFNASGKYNGKDLGNLGFYTDNKKAMVNLPIIYDKWIAFDCDNIQNQYNNSILGKYGKMPEEEISIKIFPDETTEITTVKELKEKIIQEYLKVNKDKLEEIAKNINVEKLDKTKEIMINGEKQSCKGYSVFISKSEVNEFLESVYAYVETDKQAEITLKELVDRIESINELKNLNDYPNYNKDIKDVTNYLRKNFSVGDISMKVYLDKHGKTAGVDLDTKLKSKDKTFGINLSSEYRGKDNIGDDIGLIMNIDNGNSKLNLDLNLKNVDEGTTTKDIISGTITMDGDKLNVNCNTQYDTSSKNITGEFKLDSEGENILLNYNGKYDFNKESKKLLFDLDKVNFETNTNNEKNHITFDFLYGIEPLKESIKEPNGEKFEIFKANENELVEAVLKMEENVSGLEQTLNID